MLFYVWSNLYQAFHVELEVALGINLHIVGNIKSNGIPTGIWISREKENYFSRKKLES